MRNRSIWQHVVGTIRRRVNDRRLSSALRAAKGVIHVGANIGQERDRYQRHKIDVLWVEPIPSVFAQLELNIAHLARQRAVNALVAEHDGRSVTFHVSSNDGLSSSMLDLADHRDIWPDVSFVNDLRLTTVTLPTLLRQYALEASAYDMLVLDTQGSELLVLQGALPLLPAVKFIHTEVADFEAYAGCVQRPELTAFLAHQGFVEWAAEPFARRTEGGQYFDILYRRR